MNKKQSFLEWTMENHSDIMHNNAIIAKLKELCNKENSDNYTLQFDFPYNCHLPKFKFITCWDYSPELFVLSINIFDSELVRDQLAILEYVWSYLED